MLKKGGRMNAEYALDVRKATLTKICMVKMRRVVLAAGFDLPLPSFQTSPDVRAMYLGGLLKERLSQV